MHGSHRNPLANRHPRFTTQELPQNHHKMQVELKCDQKTNCVPTVVNGQINQNKKDNNINRMNSRWDHVNNLVRETTAKVLNNKAE